MSSQGMAAAAIDDMEPELSGLIVDVDIQDDGWRAAVDDPAGLCERAAAAAFERAAGDLDAAEVSIVLGDDAFVMDLNRRYRGKDKPTNVLSFPGDLETPPGVPALLGDIAIARETVEREAADEDKSVADHLSHMVVHGVLHLLGHDHEDDGEAAAMESLETVALAALGVADPYGADGD